MDFWTTLFDIGAILAVAFLLGALCERFRQSALLGYLLAGMLLGPNALNVVSSRDEVEGLAEVGVSLLLFSLGLEFSWRRLRSLGTTALGGGALQVVLTLSAVSAVGTLLGLRPQIALVLGAAFALSSTAGVLRVLMARTEIDSVHGRHALGVLLFQDLAVVPLVLLARFLARPKSDSAALSGVAEKGLLLLAMVVGFYLIFSQIVPRVLLVTSTLRNRELPVLFAVVGSLASIYVAHELGLSPAVGAFIAGMLLGESPFATLVRSDLAVLRTLLVTLFFSSVGMLADPGWMLLNLGPLTGIVIGVIVLKTLVAAVSLRVMRQSTVSSLATGLCLSQVGEFAFVIAGSARGTLIDEDLFKVIVSTMMATLFLTPYLVAVAPTFSSRVLRGIAWLGLVQKPESPPESGERALSGHVVLVGYGPAGQQCGAALREREFQVAVLDLNPRLVRHAQEAGFTAHVGDAGHPEVFDHLQIRRAAAVVVTVPDPRMAEEVVRLARSQSQHVPVVVRSRYHKYIGHLQAAGASAVVDEENDVGRLLGSRVVALLSEHGSEDGKEE